MNPIINYILGTTLMEIILQALWIILLPLGLLIASPILSIAGTIQNKSIKNMYRRFIEIWTDAVF
jgi:hypothetical protein